MLVCERCVVSPDVERLEQSFWGQMSSLYFFNQPLSADVVRALFDLGPSYSGQFSGDEAVLLSAVSSSRASSVLFDGTLQYVPAWMALSKTG